MYCVMTKEGIRCKPGLGFLPAIIGAAAPIAAAALGPDAPSGPGKRERDAAARAAKLRAQEAETQARLEAAQGERGKVIKYALLGTGGLLLVGAGILWIVSRNKSKGAG